MTVFNGVDQYADITGINNGTGYRIRLTMAADYQAPTASVRCLYSASGGGTGNILHSANNDNISRTNVDNVAVDTVGISSLNGTTCPSGSILSWRHHTNSSTSCRLFANSALTQYVGATVTLVEIWNRANSTLLHSFDLSSPSSTTVNDSVGSAVLTLQNITIASFVIDSTDATMQRGTSFELVCSGATTAPTTANTTLSNGNDTLTPTSVTGSDPYTLTFPVGDLTKQVDATGYDWTLTVDAETDTTGNIPLVIQAGYTKVDLVNPVTTNASLLFGVTGDAPVTGDDLEYDVTSVLDSGVDFDVAANAVWTITEANEGDWTTAITVSRRVVQADGTIGTEAVMTFDPTEGSGPPATAGSIPYAMRQMAMRLSFHSYLIQESKGRWEQDQLNAAIVALGGSAMTPPVGAPDAAVGYTGTQTYLEFYKRLQRALVYPTPIDVVPAVQAALLARGWTL